MTGFGLAVALPAVLVYNYFLRRLKLTAADLDIPDLNMAEEPMGTSGLHAMFDADAPAAPVSPQVIPPDLHLRELAPDFFFTVDHAGEAEH